eukprot:CAMPEP_0177789240 /NCGR_PEP_ID=MMETSP0491_2-20121128/22629_1 /TAXON_ID=63592 /ORGANISM="Tetraselmis chuii, Strain PLY429" /LENGTH=304 /DNA_ID=CAMNT_0019311061 /DNA_START=38 /DNA_END=952 /DNA_ORIENTATION=+
MHIFTDRAEMRSFSRASKAAGKRVGLVPTMGYLHAGHLSLIEGARQHADVVMVSIYVNPTQFIRVGEDFDVYPRDVEGDREKLRQAGVDAVFEPESLYQPAPALGSSSFVVGQHEHVPGSHETFVQVEHLQKGLCGITRPHFFRGVATICCKLFNIVEPDVAVFGRKDYQQWKVICRMVRDLDFDIKIIGMPLMREADGIAMSSRNVRLTKDERERALCINAGLKWAQQSSANGVTESATLQQHIVNAISAAGGQVDYVEVLDAENLNPVPTVTGERDAVIAVAAKFGSVRLLDNIVIGGEGTR